MCIHVVCTCHVNRVFPSPLASPTWTAHVNPWRWCYVEKPSCLTAILSWNTAITSRPERGAVEGWEEGMAEGEEGRKEMATLIPAAQE